MATKEEVTEFCNVQWDTGEDSSIDRYWIDNFDGGYGNRLSIMQNWITPEIAVILQKLVGDVHLVRRVSQNRSNNS